MSVDPRGQRFNAALSAIVLVLVLITGSGWLLGLQAVVFGIGAVFGLRYAPYGLIYRLLSGRGWGRPRNWRPRRRRGSRRQWAWSSAVIGVIGYAAGLAPLGMAAAAAALAAAFLNAAFGFCLGCEMYRADQTTPARPPGDGRRRSPTRRLLHEPSRRPGGRRLGGGPRG